MEDLKFSLTVLNNMLKTAHNLEDTESIDEINTLIKEAENFDHNIKTASVKVAFLRRLFKGIDKFVRKNLGGWATVIGLVGAPYLAKLAPNMKGFGKQVLDFVKKGGDPTTLLTNPNQFLANAARQYVADATAAGAKQPGGTVASPKGPTSTTTNVSNPTVTTNTGTANVGSGAAINLSSGQPGVSGAQPIGRSGPSMGNTNFATKPVVQFANSKNNSLIKLSALYSELNSLADELDKQGDFKAADYVIEELNKLLKSE